MKILKNFLLIILFLGIYSCSKNVPEKSEEELKMEIEKTLENYIEAIKTSNVEAVLEFWIEDCRSIEGNSDIKGKEELRELLIPIYKTLTIFELDVTTKSLDITENLAVHITEHSEILSEGGKRTGGEKLFIWKKENGKWKISMDYSIPSQRATNH